MSADHSDSLRPIPGPDPGACPKCGKWRRAGTRHTCRPKHPADDRSKPLYEHDCDKCVFLGRVALPGLIVGEGDAYYCSQGGIFSTIVVRHGADGPEYMSGWGLLDSLPTPLTAEAYRLAQKAGV